MAQIKNTTPENTAFTKGMTLVQYLSDMKMKQATPSIEQTANQDEDLYQTSKIGHQSISKKLITYQIRESDEDDYDQSVEENGQEYHRAKFPSELVSLGKSQRQIQRRSNKNIVNMNADFEDQPMLRNSKGFRVRKQSNSPYNFMKKDYSPPKDNRNLARSLYNGKWKIQRESPQKSNALSGATLYGSFLKGVKQKNNEQHFKQKNSRQLQYVMKYEKDMNSKYSSFQSANFRVEGITDRLYQRRNKMIK